MPMSQSMHEPFKRVPGFPAAFHLTQMGEIPTDFHSQVLWGSSSWHWYSRLRKPAEGWGPLIPREDLCSGNIPPIMNCCTWRWGQFYICILPTSLDVATSLVIEFLFG